MSNNQLAVTHYLRSNVVQQRVEDLLGERAGQFTTTLMSAINANPMLQECEPDSVLKAAITAASMDLPVNQSLGFAYLVPYNNKKKIKELQYFTNDQGEKEPKLDNKGEKVYITRQVWVTEAQFQMGYKGFIQLAQRSGQFKRINVTDVREGEYKGENRKTGELEIEFMDDNTERNKKPVVGYLAYFLLMNGFEKELYMSKDELTKHGKQYSQSFKKGYGLWADEFDTMARKTVLKLLISRFGPLSTDSRLQEAVQADQSAVGDDYNYVDNQKEEETKEDDTADKKTT